MNIKKLNSLLEKVMDKPVITSKNRKNEAVLDYDNIEFDSFGGSINVYLRTKYFKSTEFGDVYGDSVGYIVGLNSASMGSIYYAKPIESTDTKKDQIWTNRQNEDEIRENLIKDLKAAADKFDEEITAIMDKHGFKRK